jgi:hypothetical protein
MNNYTEACKSAAEAQGLGQFWDRPGWQVEQTGGFTMVACRYLDGTVWTVTHESEDEDGGYLAAHQPREAWEDSTLWDEAHSKGEVTIHENLTRAQVFAVAEAR